MTYDETAFQQDERRKRKQEQNIEWKEEKRVQEKSPMMYNWNKVYTSSRDVKISVDNDD